MKFTDSPYCPLAKFQGILHALTHVQSPSLLQWQSAQRHLLLYGGLKAHVPRRNNREKPGGQDEQHALDPGIHRIALCTKLNSE